MTKDLETMQLFKTLERTLRRGWNRFRKKPESSRFHRPQEKFRAKYPSYAIGVGTYGLPIVHDWDEGSTLRIGSYCSIADGVRIYLGGQHRIDWVSSYPFPAYLPEAQHIGDYGGTRGDVVVGSDVWLCSQCTILSGVEIGHGAVVASGAVVSRDVPPYSVVAGNPAKHVRWRFDEPTRNALLAIAWWEWPEEEVRRNVEKLCSNDIAAFIAYARSRR